MRTTVELSAEAYHFAKAVAREKNQSLGKAMSDLILRRNPEPRKEFKRSSAGFPVFSSGKPITNEEVQDLLDEERD